MKMKDTHECCPVCLGWKHAQEALARTNLCDHCLRLGSTFIGHRAELVRKIGTAGEGSTGDLTLIMGLSEAGRERQWWSELIGVSSQPCEAHSGFSGSVQSPDSGMI